MRNRIFKYFFVSLLILISGVVYLVMVHDNRIIVKQRAVNEANQEKNTELSVKMEKRVEESQNQSKFSSINQKNLEIKEEKNVTEKSNSISEVAVPNENNQQKIETSEKDSNRKININQAEKSELMTLKGIGEKKADLIIKYRTEKGAFKRIEDIMKIKGIKRKAFEKIKDTICVSD